MCARRLCRTRAPCPAGRLRSVVRSFAPLRTAAALLWPPFEFECVTTSYTNQLGSSACVVLKQLSAANVAVDPSHLAINWTTHCLCTLTHSCQHRATFIQAPYQYTHTHALLKYRSRYSANRCTDCQYYRGICFVATGNIAAGSGSTLRHWMWRQSRDSLGNWCVTSVLDKNVIVLDGCHFWFGLVDCNVNCKFRLM